MQPFQRTCKSIRSFFVFDKEDMYVLSHVDNIIKFICSKTGRIRVNTGLPHDDAVRTLRKLFAKCGEMTDVYIRIIDDNLLSKYAFIYFTREEAVDKALQLNGKDV